MTNYRNLTGNSGVASYMIEPDSIIVRFADDWMYQYTFGSAGRFNIEQMKMLAEGGRGLNSFINRYVRNSYSRKFR